MIPLAENSQLPTIGIAIENPLMIGAVSRILQGLRNYEVTVFDKSEVTSGSWPERSCQVVVTSPNAFQRRNETQSPNRSIASSVILALKRSGLSCHRDIIAAADSFVLMDETLPLLPSLVLLSSYGLTIMPRPLNGGKITVSPRLDRLKKLSPKDLRVLRELGRGAGNHTISKRLGMSIPMAKVHIHRIIERLAFRNRTDAAIFGALWFVPDRCADT
jgi:DNA-binding NarL/FixJ family response regulator